MKTVLVTGGDSGLGAAISEVFASHKYNVIINYHKNEEAATALVNKITKEYGIKAISIKADISNEDDVNNMKEIIVKEFNDLDVIVNNAGIAIDSDFTMKTKKSFHDVLDTNLIGPFLVANTLSFLMQKGSIINISSNNGIDDGYPESIEYDASKAGLISLTHNMAKYYAPKIRVNAIAPGWINTPMNKDLDEEFVIKANDKCLLNRFASPREIANVVYFLASDEASYINDAIIRVDGGLR